MADNRTQQEKQHAKIPDPGHGRQRDAQTTGATGQPKRTR